MSFFILIEHFDEVSQRGLLVARLEYFWQLDLGGQPQEEEVAK